MAVARSIAAVGIAIALGVAALGCSASGAKRSYVLAEKLWSDANYAAAVVEFEKVYAKEPRGKLGQQALYRAAVTQSFFLSEYAEAVRKLTLFVENFPEDPQAWEARKLIGELLFAKLEQYDRAVAHYKDLLAMRPTAAEAPEFIYRVGKSLFFVSQFDEGIRVFASLAKRVPATEWNEKAAYEIGVTKYTRGGKVGDNESYEDAIEAYEDFIRQYPRSPLLPQARFGIAACLEEMDQLDAAYHAYQQLLSTYPSPKVIRIKLARIQERKTQRSR